MERKGSGSGLRFRRAALIQWSRGLSSLRSRVAVEFRRWVSSHTLAASRDRACVALLSRWVPFRVMSGMRRGAGRVPLRLEYFGRM